MAADEPKRCQHTLEATQIVPEHPNVLEECPPPPLLCVEVKMTTGENDETCKISDGNQETCDEEGFKGFLAEEMMPSLNSGWREVLSYLASSRRRRKIKRPVKRNAGDPKQPPFKGCRKRVQHRETRKQRRKVLLQDTLSKLDGKCSKKKASICKTEAHLPCVQKQNNSTSPHEVHQDSRKATDSEDVIESSQDTNYSLLIASKLPLTQKCSLSACRIDTTLEPGATIIVPDGDSRYLVFRPESPGSPFKVFKDDPRHRGNQPHSSQEINTSQCEDIVVKKDKGSIRKSWSKQQLSTGDSNDNHLSSVKEDSQECHSKQDINKSTLEDTQLTPVRENGSKRKHKKPFNASNCDGHVLKLLKEDIPRPEPEQHKSETCGLTAAKEGPLKPRAREHTVASKHEVISLAEGLKAVLKHDSTVTARKKLAPLEVPSRQAATTLDNPTDAGASKIKKLSLHNSEDGRLSAKSVCDKSVSAQSEVKLCNVASSYQTLRGSVAQCETSPPASMAYVANVLNKGARRLALREQGAQPSQKKRVWFPDPEVTNVKYFSIKERGFQSGSKRRSPYAMTGQLIGKRRAAGRCRAAGSSGTSLEDKSPLSFLSTSSPDIQSPCGKESPSSPDLTGLASQGSVDETAPELLNSQDALFPPLMHCTHPIESIAARLATKMKWAKAFVDEVHRKNINTVGDMSKLDAASISRLSIATPKISHAKAVLQDYVKILQEENDEVPLSVKGGVSESDVSEVMSESIESSVSSETDQRSIEDFLKATGSKRDNLAALLKEISKVWCQYGSGLLEEEILNLLPAERIVQCALSRLANDTSLDVPVSQYQKFMEAIAKRVTNAEFVKLLCNAVMTNSAPDTGCE